jgi:hypothetical protein
MFLKGKGSTAPKNFAEFMVELGRQAGIESVKVNSESQVSLGFRWDDDRHQRIFITEMSPYGDLKVANFWTVVMKLPPVVSGNVLEGLLRVSADLKIGSFSIEKYDESDHLMLHHNTFYESMLPMSFGQSY